MKKLAVIMLGLGILFTSCQQKELDQRVQNNGNVNITVYAADAISVRSSSYTSSAQGGTVNVSDLSLRYVLGIYDTDGELVGTQHVTTLSSAGATTFSLELSEGQTYTAVVWADFVAETDTDYHYDTADLTAVTYNDTYTINDESYDAYYANQSFTVNGGSVTITLYRPFAKVRLVTNDWDSSNAAADEITLTYSEGRYTTINCLTGDLDEDSIDETCTYSAAIENTYSDESDPIHTLAVDYILAPASESDVTLTYTASLSGETVHELTINQDIPYQANYLTTISGALLSTNDALNVDFDADWGGNYDYVIGDFSVEPASTTEVEGVTYFTVTVDETVTLTPSIDDVTSWTWASDDEDEDYASVSGGVVTGIAAGGPVTITATGTNSDGATCVCSISLYVVTADGQTETPAEANAGVKLTETSATCSIDAKTFDVSAYVEQPDDATQILSYSVDVEEAVATIDENGLVTFVTPGDVTITVTSDAEESDVDTDNGYAQSATFSLSVPYGYYDEEFNGSANWEGATTTAEYSWTSSYLTVSTTAYWDATANSGEGSFTSGRGDIKHTGTVYLDPTNYPIICFHIDDIINNDNVTSRDITLDTSSGVDTESNSYSGGLDGNNNKWKKNVTATDGSSFLIYNLASQEFATGGKLENNASFGTFQIKYADIKPSNSTSTSEYTTDNKLELSYNYYGFHTFADVDALNAYLEDLETGLGTVAASDLE